MKLEKALNRFYKNLLILFFFFWSFSAKAQKPNHTEMDLDSNDVFGGFLESSQNLAVKMYQLVMDNKVKIYKDSLLKKELKGKEKNKYTTSIQLICGGRPYATSPFDLKDHWDTVYYNPKSCLKINIENKYIKFYTWYQPRHFEFHYYMPLDKTFSLLNTEEKEFFDFWVKNMEGKINNENIQNYTQNYLKKKLERIYQLSLYDSIPTYRNTKLVIRHTPEEVTELGNIKEVYHNESTYDIIDSIIITPISPKTLKGFKVIYHQKTDSNMHAQFQITALGLLYKHDEDTSKGYKNLYYLKPEDIFGMFSKEEKLLWDAMIQFHIFKRFEED